MKRPRLDEAGLVVIAAVASGTAPEDVLATTDLAALARVVSVIEACDADLDVAAAALVEIARDRPFGAGSDAAAWLACAMAAPAEAARVAVNRSDAIELVRRAACGEVSRDQVREHLASGRTRCPACRRALQPFGGTAGARPPTRCSPVELVARCAMEHRAHGRFGGPFREPTAVEDTPWRPVVANQHTGAMIVLADAAPLLLLPAGESYLVAEPTFVAGDLVGDWRALIDHAVVRTSVPVAAVALDAQGSMIDTSRLDGLLQAVPALH